ncbi:Ribonuclease T2-like [Nakaseomyces bracarensis]|uniref:Ribonuclease T2-like n=1 Tax=Nakaseomyces bracarensis TaxID=273131 RepID=A0ABR4NU85_9SACH
MILRDISPLLQGLLFGSQYPSNLAASDFAPNCPIDLPFSCTNDTSISDLCCFEYPGGILLQTQFWNYAPSKPNLNQTELEEELGPISSFTIHGLWPDDCSGGYPQFCRRNLFIDDVYYLLKSKELNGDDPSLPISGEDLLEKLDTYWKSNNGNHESLWIHEYNKHGTCLSTLQPNCYKRWAGVDNNEANLSDQYYKKRAVYDYFRVSYDLFAKLDSYKMLEKHGISPSNTTSYSKAEILQALSSEFDGVEAHINCDSKNALTEIWYYHHLKGSILDEQFQPIPSLKSFSRCKDEGIKYYPKGYNPRRNYPPGKKPALRGTLRVSDYGGFLIKNGKWMTKGTPANFELIKAAFGNFYLKSRNGFCSVKDENSNELVCRGRSQQLATQFEYDEETGLIGYSGSFEWATDKYPKNSRTRRESIFSVSNGQNKELKYKFKLRFNKR